VIWADPEVPAQLCGDPLRLSQVLVNLVGNALKFTAHGHIAVRVTLDTAAQAPPDCIALRFTVEDTGLGISAEQQQRLFQAFAQADASTTRLYGGTGLGLAISQQLVRKMGGVIRLDSEPGAGSRFSFAICLPCPGGQEPRLPPAPSEVQGRRVLVLDDSAPAAQALATQLRALGLRVRSAATLPEAATLLAGEPCELLMVDWGLPDMNGVEALQLLRADAALAAIPAIIMASAYAREQSREAQEYAGVLPFLDKPVNPYLLRSAVLIALGAETEQMAVRPAAAPSAAMQRIRGARVLVVDDNTINQQVAREILQRAGVQVALASSGAEAARMNDEAHYDAILMDIQMPDMDGYQATALIRASERHPSLPIIAMTAHAVGGYRERCLALDMNDYVTKPIEPDTLYAVLANWVQGDAGAVASAVPPPVLPQAAPRPGIDIPAALERLGGHGALLNRLLNLFIQDFGASLQHIEEAIASGDLDRAAQLVHKVRGAAGNLSATGLFDAAGALEERLRAPELSLPVLLADFAKAHQEVLAGARQHLDRPDRLAT
jgi:CheY-like chemotaxis protein